jgi:L,D-transpeptidase ErfK/SrfK
LSGSESLYVAQQGDSFASVGSRFAVEPSVLARSNGLKTSARLRPGAIIRVNNRHVVPGAIEEGILVSIAQRLLFFFKGGALRAVYPVAPGRPGGETPRGDFTVTRMEVDPVWTVPKSIQREMAKNGKRVRTKVPPGPDNPLGKYWIGLNRDEIGIHATIAPRSIYHFRSHGCIRMNPADAAQLFGMVAIGTPVRIIYEPVLLGFLDDGRIFVEANPDAYRRAPNMLEDLRNVADSRRISEAIDWRRVEEVLQTKDGLAHEVSIASARDGGGAIGQMAAVKSSYGYQPGPIAGQERPRHPVRQD